MDVNIIKLEDNLEYIILLALSKNENNYFVLAKKDAESEFTLRKVVKDEDGKEYLELLDDEIEFEEVMTLVNEKLNMKDEGKNEK